MEETEDRTVLVYVLSSHIDEFQMDEEPLPPNNGNPHPIGGPFQPGPHEEDQDDDLPPPGHFGHHDWLVWPEQNQHENDNVHHNEDHANRGQQPSSTLANSYEEGSSSVNFVLAQGPIYSCPYPPP